MISPLFKNEEIAALQIHQFSIINLSVTLAKGFNPELTEMSKNPIQRLVFVVREIIQSVDLFLFHISGLTTLLLLSMDAYPQRWVYRGVA